MFDRAEDSLNDSFFQLISIPVSRYYDPEGILCASDEKRKLALI